MLRIHRRAYRRRDGTPVHSTNFLAKDRGKKGRGKQVIPKSKVKKDILGEGFFSASEDDQKKQLDQQVKKRGEKSVMGQLMYVGYLQKNINPKVKKQAVELRKWVAQTYQKKRRL
jgi:hypothetical protein